MLTPLSQGKMRSQRPPRLKGGQAPLLFKLQGAWSQMRVRVLTPPAYLHPSLIRPIIKGMNTVKSSLSSFSDADVGYNKQSTSDFLVRLLLPVAM